MSTELAFVGDVHGNLLALRGIWRELLRREVAHTVFLGDYINKGPYTAEVLQELIAYRQTGTITLLLGNHEAALLEAVDRDDISGFLKMGGARAILSYVGGTVGPDVLCEFKASLPSEHLEALRAMPLSYETDQLFAQHSPSTDSAEKYRISAHVPVGDRPRIRKRSAQLDTGCGAGAGRLTALLWPTREFVQVDGDGDVVRS